MVGGKLGKCPPASPMLVLGHQNNFAPGRSACPVRAVPATGGPPPRTHGSAGQAQGAGEQNPGQEAGPSAGPGMWSTGSRSRAWRRTRTSVGQSPSLAHAALRYAAPPAGATTSSLDLALPAPSPTSRRLPASCLAATPPTLPCLAAMPLPLPCPIWIAIVRDRGYPALLPSQARRVGRIGGVTHASHAACL